MNEITYLLLWSLLDRVALKASLLLLPLLGITWLLGFLQVNSDTAVMSYAFVLLSSFQVATSRAFAFRHVNFLYYSYSANLSTIKSFYVPLLTFCLMSFQGVYFFVTNVVMDQEVPRLFAVMWLLLAWCLWNSFIVLFVPCLSVRGFSFVILKKNVSQFVMTLSFSVII